MGTLPRFMRPKRRSLEGNVRDLYRSDGTLVGWGSNASGQTNVPAGTFTALAAGALHSLATRSDPAPDPALHLHTDSAFKPGSNIWTISSDRRLKKNIEPLSGALDRLLQLHGVTFQWLDPASQGGITGTQMALIADEVSRASPQWVGRDPNGYQTLTVGATSRPRSAPRHPTDRASSPVHRPAAPPRSARPAPTRRRG